MKLQRLAVCASLTVSIASCGSKGSTAAAPAATSATPSTAAPTASAAAPASAIQVVIRGYVFPAVTAAPGATLTLVDRDDEPHTVTADDGSFKAGPFDNTAPTTLVAPTKAGSYPFHCEIHPTMHGTLVVNNQ